MKEHIIDCCEDNSDHLLIREDRGDANQIRIEMNTGGTFHASVHLETRESIDYLASVVLEMYEWLEEKGK